MGDESENVQYQTVSKKKTKAGDFLGRPLSRVPQAACLWYAAVTRDEAQRRYRTFYESVIGCCKARCKRV